MGVLEVVTDDHAGIIPRSISRIFEHVKIEESLNKLKVTVTISFLQLYRESLQDLLPKLKSNVTDGCVIHQQGSSSNSMLINVSTSYDDQSCTSTSTSYSRGIMSSQQSQLPSTLLVEPLLTIREDPVKGVFVDGLQEYEVTTYDEAGTYHRV